MTEPAWSGHPTGVWQLRLDSWSALHEAANRLAAGSDQPAHAGAVRAEILVQRLKSLELYWAFPGRRLFQEAVDSLEQQDWPGFASRIARIHRSLIDDAYREGPTNATWESASGGATEEDLRGFQLPPRGRPYFEVLLVDSMSASEEADYQTEIAAQRRTDDAFTYEVVVVPSLEDAAVAVQCNFLLQACVIRQGAAVRSINHVDELPLLYDDDWHSIDQLSSSARAQLAAQRIARIRPELDTYLIADESVEEAAGAAGPIFRRVFYQRESGLELHLTILQGIRDRYQTPFFDALRDYSQRPTGVFHALPISRGASVLSSHWISDMARFYGRNIFLAETSSTSGGLDSLLEPTGPLKQAQELAASTFGARSTYFVTNGTSTANKIVVQALLRPGDIALVDRNCHKSHHYALALVGASVAYLDAYELNRYGMFGAVPLATIKDALLAHQRAGTLDRVKLLMLTNCTFDGIVHDVERVMHECLAIKPDLVFLWDEAWFAFARFHPIHRSRTAMWSANRLRDRYQSAQYAEEHARLGEAAGPDPAKVRIRVYSTQSTHKTLTALRQGSMIHVWDQDFSQKVADPFREAYMTHTSTSPNYQILASLDLGRRQAELEGFDLVQGQIEYALRLRDAVSRHPVLREELRFLDTEDLIPAIFRSETRPPGNRLASMATQWQQDEFVVDPSRATLFTGALGVSGDDLKIRYLMDRHGVQINKTSLNTALFMTHIGTTRSSIAYLLEVLVNIVGEVRDSVEDMTARQRAAYENERDALSAERQLLPTFGSFHPRFRPGLVVGTTEGDLRSAFFLAYDAEACVHLTSTEIRRQLGAGKCVVSASFVTPYPPGFPVLVPGQILTAGLLDFMQQLRTPEIHGYQPTEGYRVFTDQALQESKN